MPMIYHEKKCQRCNEKAPKNNNNNTSSLKVNYSHSITKKWWFKKAWINWLKIDPTWARESKQLVHYTLGITDNLAKHELLMTTKIKCPWMQQNCIYLYSKRSFLPSTTSPSSPSLSIIVWAAPCFTGLSLIMCYNKMENARFAIINFSYHRRKINKGKSTRNARISFFDHTNMAQGAPLSLKEKSIAKGEIWWAQIQLNWVATISMWGVE